MVYTVGSLFTGIGGMDLAFERAGFQIAYQVEIDDYCTKILERHWPGVARHRDIRATDAHNLPTTDVLAGGFPCQDISNAGQRRGIKEGTRSGLWFEFARLISELRPRIVFLENVAAITSRGGERVIADLTALGYDTEWGIIPASAVGAPHRRERWWCVAYAESSGNQRERFCLAETQSYPEEQNDGAEFDGGYSAVVNANNERQQEQRGDFAAKSPLGGSERTGSNLMGYTEHDRREGRQSDGEGPATANLSSCTEQGTVSQSILGRTIDGLSRQLDSARWPARPGEAQYPWEAPRTINYKLPDRAARLKALGNAVVPQVVQPIAECILAYLTEADTHNR